MKVQQLMWEDTKKKRGYGFITFDDFDAVDKVIVTTKSKMLNLNSFEIADCFYAKFVIQFF